MAGHDALTELSSSLATRAAVARGFVAEIRFGESHHRSGTLWRPDVVIASEQTLPEAETFDVVLANGVSVRAKLAGRDKGTNVAVLQLETPATVALPAAAAAQAGTIALAYGADGNGGVSSHMGIVGSVGPAWHSRAGGRIDARITLDLNMTYTEEGGPVLDASGALLGISTLGLQGRVLAIPAATVERVLEPLLANGRIDRGWLGLALQPVAVPDALRAETNQAKGLMVMSIVADAPAAKAGIVAGDILLEIGGAPVTRSRRLSEQLGPDSVGKTIALRIIRAGAITTVSAAITARPANG